MEKEVIKPGYKTTEFWTMIASSLFGVMIMFGIITEAESNALLASVNSISGGIITVASVISYIWSRGKIKSGGNGASIINYLELIEGIKSIISKNKENKDS